MFARFLVFNAHSCDNRAKPLEMQMIRLKYEEKCESFGVRNRLGGTHNGSKWDDKMRMGRRQMYKKKLTLFSSRLLSFHFSFRSISGIPPAILSELRQLSNEVKHQTVIAQEARKWNFSYSPLNLCQTWQYDCQYFILFHCELFGGSE